MLWIEIVGWDTFQHYKDRQPVWIKLYPKLLDNEDYLQLPVGARLLLIELWMLYAQTGAQVRLDTRSLHGRLRHRTTSEQIEALRDAGFIRVRASKPLAHRYPRGRERKDLGQMGISQVLKNLQ